MRKLHRSVLAVTVLAAWASAASAADRPSVLHGGGPALSPAARQLQELSKSLSSEFAKKFLAQVAPIATSSPDGTISLQLDPSFLAVTVVTVSPSGVVSEVCVNGLDQAAAIVAANTPAVEEF